MGAVAIDGARCVQASLKRCELDERFTEWRSALAPSPLWRAWRNRRRDEPGGSTADAYVGIVMAHAPTRGEDGLISPHGFRHGRRAMKKQPFFTRRRRRLHSQSRLQRPVGPELDARPRHHRPARPCHRAAPRLGRFRAGAADGRHVPAADIHGADRGHHEARSATASASRWSKPNSSPAAPHGARVLPVVAPDGKCAGQCLVAAELGRAAAGRRFPRRPIQSSA